MICNFAWTNIDRIRETNDYVLDAARRSGGRLIPFCMVQAAEGEAHVRGEMQRVALAGARGIGELRPEQQGYSLAQGRAPSLLAWGSSAYDLQLLIHVTEPVGHRYPGKPGAPMAEFAQFLNHHPEAQVIGAHWGGGLPFYALMKEVRDDLDRVHVDSAATGYLYDDAVFRIVGELLGYGAILFASDYPCATRRPRSPASAGWASRPTRNPLSLAPTCSDSCTCPIVPATDDPSGDANRLRLFVALIPPTAVIEALVAAQRSLRAVLAEAQPDLRLRWVGPHGFHLTLRFLGHTPRDRLVAIAEAMRTVAETTAPLSLRLDRLGTLGGRRPRVVPRLAGRGNGGGSRVAARLGDGPEYRPGRAGLPDRGATVAPPPHARPRATARRSRGPGRRTASGQAGQSLACAPLSGPVGAADR